MAKQLNYRYRVAVLLSAACYPKPIWLVIWHKATGCKAAMRFQVASSSKPPPVRPNQRLPENPRSKTQGFAVACFIRIVVMRCPADIVTLCLRNQHRFLPEARRTQQNPAVAAHGLNARIVLPNGVQAAFDAAVGQFGGQLRLQRGKPLDFLFDFGGAAVVGILRGQQEQRGNGGDCAEAEGGEGLFGEHGAFLPAVGC